jgi:serine/threonine protein kinase
MTRELSGYERRIVRRLEGRGLAELGHALTRLHGSEVGGHFRIDALFAAGADGAIYFVRDVRGTEPRPRLVAKLPLLTYHRPVSLESDGIRRRRESIREEARLLAQSASAFLPACIGLFEMRNPLLSAARGGAFAEPEAVLVMERLPGFDLDAWLARMHRGNVDVKLLRPALDTLAVDLLQGLWDLQERGFYYADLRPGNVRIGGPERRARLLDAGSLVRRDDCTGRFPHVPAYLPPEVFVASRDRGESIHATAATLAVMTGRTLYEVATGRVPLPGEPVDASALRDSRVSAHVAAAIEALATGALPDVREGLLFLKKEAARRRPWWRKALGR